MASPTNTYFAHDKYVVILEGGRSIPPFSSSTPSSEEEVSGGKK